MQDSLGNPLTLDEPGSLAAVNDFVEGFIACEARAINVLAVAEQDHSPLVQAYVAALQMFAETPQAPALARPFIERALAGSTRATAQEQRMVAAIAAWVNGDIEHAIALHQEQAALHPRDLASLKLGQYHLFNRGDSPAMLQMALQAAPAAADVPYLHGMLAFAYEQTHQLQQAEQCARHAVAMLRKEPWAHHALAHVMLTQSRIHEGLDFLASVSDSWTGLNSFMVTHNWWHQALFLLELGDHTAVLALYDQQVWGVAKDYSQDQINAISLLARLELAGVNVGARWADVGQYLLARTQDQVLPFLDVQYLYGLARAGHHRHAAALLAQIKIHAMQLNAPHQRHEQKIWSDVALPVATGLLAHAQGDYQGAARALAQALPQLESLGGSHAQRDLFEQIYLDALLKSGQENVALLRLTALPQVSAESRRLAALRRRAGG